MNANAAPISTTTATQPRPVQGHPFGTDAVYKGYDLMVRRAATHIIREHHLITASRADLIRAISSPAVTFAASASDGAIMISCPDGLPDLLIHLAEKLADDRTEPAAPLQHALAQLDQKLTSLIQDQQVVEGLADRLDLLEHRWRDKPEVEAARALDTRLDQLADQIAAVQQAVLTVEQLSGQLATQLAAIAQADQMLARVETRLEDLANRPVPAPDMAPHHDALASLATRLDHAIDRLPDPQALLAQTQSLATLIEAGSTEVERRLTPHLAQVSQALALTAQATDTQSALTALAQQISALTDRPLPVLDLAAQNAGLTQIAATLTEMTAQIIDLTRITTVGPDLGPLVAQFENLRISLGEPAQSADIGMALTQLAALASGTDMLLTSLGQPAQSADIATVLSRIGTDIAAFATAQDTLLANLGQPAQTSHMVTALAGLATLTERPGPVLDLTEQNQFLGDIANTLTRLSDDHNALLTLLGTPAQSAAVLAALADFGTELARIAARPELVLDLNTVSQQLDSLVATQSNQLDQVLATLGQPAQEAMLARTAAQVSQLAQRLDSLGDSLAAGPDLSPLVDQFAAGIAMLGQPAQNAAMLAALADLTEQVAIVAERPDPVIDMTAQRQSFAQFGTALGLAVQRLEAVADSVVDGRTAAPDLAPILAQLDALRADLPKMATDAATAQTLVQFSDQIAALAQHPDHGPAILAELADLAGQLAGLTRDVAQTPDILGPVQRLQAVVMAVPNAVSAQLATHVAQPAPVLDLSDLRADFARFAATLAEAVLRLENVARQVAAETPIVVTQITALQDDIALQRHDMVRRDDWAALSLNLATLVDRTDPAPDIAEHKLHMSAFAQGLAELVQWLEPVTRDLAAGPDFGPIVTEFDLLRAELNTATRDSAVEASFAHLSDQIADLAKSPDGLVSLTEQRRSFASFSNALAFMLHRLEAQGHATQTVTPHPDLTTDADDRLNHMVQNLSTPAGLAQGQTQADQGSSLSRLVLRLEHLLDKLDPPQTPLAPMPVPPGINPAQMVENLSTATTALAHVVNLLETAAGLSGLSPAASVADLFDRLDAVLNRHDLRDIAGNPALTEVIHDLIFAVHGSADTPVPSGQQAERLLHLRVDFAELMARALQAQSETTLPCP